jgi:hypothetical protein
VLPFLTTLAVGAAISLSASIAFSALYSWKKPSTPDKITISKIMIESAVSPSKADTAAAAIRIIIKKLLNCDINISRRELFFSSMISFKPCVFKRATDSCSVIPPTDVPSDSRTASIAWS